jgi:hypothetical protein
MSRARSLSQSVAGSATGGSVGGSRRVSQLSQSQPDEFPIAALPYEVYVFVDEVAAALGVDHSLIAGPCLAAISGCIGNRRRIIVKTGSWAEPAILWVVIVQPSGGKKTPAVHTVLEHLHTREAAEIERETANREEYEQEIERLKSAPRSKRRKRPEKPEPANRFLVSDTTAEALLAIHARAPLGLLLHRDELGGWFRSFNQYKAGGQGGDAQVWAELHQGKPALIDRKAGGTLSVPRAAVSIIGGIQPELLQATLAGEHLFDGIASRILFVAPAERLKKWNEATINNKTRKMWTGRLDKLLALQPDKDGAPVDLPMTRAAKALWVRFYRDHAQRETQECGPLRSALAKLEAVTARLALVVQLADDPQSTAVGVRAMRDGIALGLWFESQARRVYRGLEETKQQKDRRAAYDWIERNHGF